MAQHRFWRPAILLLGLAISAAVAGVVHDMLGEESAAQREIARQSLAAGLQSHIERELDFTQYFRGLYDSSDFVSVVEFRRFAQLDPDIRKKHWWVNVAWAPLESAAAATARFPLTYIEPMPSGERLGMDAAADPQDRALMMRAAALGQTVITPPRPMTLAGHRSMSIKAFMPIFRDPSVQTVTALRGFLVATISLEGFFNQFLADAFVDTTLSVRIYDGNALVFASGTAYQTVAPTTLAVADRTWRLEVDGQAQPIESGLWLPGLIFGIGLALTVLLYLRLLRADTEYRRIADEVSHATAGLADANHRLAERSAALQRIADDLRRTSQEAEFANAAKTVFLANMSHELRTPLNAVIGFSEMIASRALGENSPRYYEYANDIRSSGRYLLSIIEDLLDMSRIELGQMQLKEEPVALADIAGDVVKFLTLRARDKRIALRLQGFEGLPRVMVDPKAMRQALINLLTNAVKFSPKESEVLIRGALELGGIALSVIDRGLGIKPEDLPRIFEPFWQNEAYRRQSKEGIGLGLAITQRLVQAHGGTIEAQSREGEGTAVTIHLPASRIIRGTPKLSVVGGNGGGL
ncbi:sensor histidine kinase [Dongia sedimenti]|uniref:histidine kinase n=1 Tax=Dongia sedimenti TaxID=3064282 RepID=A0ABU0YL41_9PROT|nr:ATP-binding protein [Rhodospirillaceae bacterium R-7]